MNALNASDVGRVRWSVFFGCCSLTGPMVHHTRRSAYRVWVRLPRGDRVWWDGPVTGFDDAALLSDRFRQHARACSSPLYAALMAAMADDWDDGGPVRTVCEGWEHAQPGSVVQLRLLAGLHRIVLRGDAPELAPYYRNLGGTLPPDGAWPVAREVVAAHVEELRAGL